MHAPASSTEPIPIKPGDAIHTAMSPNACATLGGRLKVHNQDLLMTAAHPFTALLPASHTDEEQKKVYLGSSLDAGILCHSSHSSGRPELNYALILPRPETHIADNVELTSSPVDGLKFPHFTSEHDFANLAGTRVRSVLASAGEVAGKINTPIPMFLILPGSSELSKVYKVEFDVPLARGVAGAWVFDASNDSLLGHIVAGIPEAGVAMIVPAYEVFADLAKVVADGLVQ